MRIRIWDKGTLEGVHAGLTRDEPISILIKVGEKANVGGGGGGGGGRQIAISVIVTACVLVCVTIPHKCWRSKMKEESRHVEWCRELARVCREKRGVSGRGC